MTPEEWYNKKKKAYKDTFGVDWKYLDPFGTNRDESSVAYETMMRMGVERSHFNKPTPDEDTLIANSILIKDCIRFGKEKPWS